MELITYRRHGFQIVEIGERVTMFTDISAVRECMDRFLSQEIRRIALYLPEVAYIGSRSIGVVVACNEMVRESGGLLVVVSAAPQIPEVLTSLDIRERFVLCPSIEKLAEIPAESGSDDSPAGTV
jgi:anti-anti-sigma factor